MKNISLNRTARFGFSTITIIITISVIALSGVGISFLNSGGSANAAQSNDPDKVDFLSSQT